MNTNEAELDEMQYEVVADKSISDQDELFKLIIIGDTAVGKTCLMTRIMDNNFREEHMVTIGVEFGSFIMKMDDKVIKLQIWDTAGQESFRSITRIFYRGAQCVFLTYDITRVETFRNIKDWLGEIRQHATEDVLIYLIGNRADLEDKRQVSREDAIAFCEEEEITHFYETSAMSGQNVEKVFVYATKELYREKMMHEDEESMQSEPPTPGQRIVDNTAGGEITLQDPAKQSINKQQE